TERQGSRAEPERDAPGRPQVLGAGPIGAGRGPPRASRWPGRFSPSWARAEVEGEPPVLALTQHDGLRTALALAVAQHQRVRPRVELDALGAARDGPHPRGGAKLERWREIGRDGDLDRRDPALHRLELDAGGLAGLPPALRRTGAQRFIDQRLVLALGVDELAEARLAARDVEQ